MRVALLGASGRIGQRIAAELERRGHEVTPLGRDSRPPVDATDPATLVPALAGHDAVISAIGPSPDADPSLLSRVAEALPEAARAAGVKRLVIVGGAGGLLLPDGTRYLDSPRFTPEYRPLALAHADAYELYRQIDDLDWSYVAPASGIAPGERTGRFRVGGDQLLVGEDGKSRISMEDYAIALVDELENGQAIRRRITVAY
jgi:putative NADH-flavin reductase